MFKLFNNPKGLSQKERIKRIFQENPGKKFKSSYFVYHLGIPRFGASIHELRKEGMNIVTTLEKTYKDGSKLYTFFYKPKS